MKKNYLMMMAMLLFAAIGFTGCGDDDDEGVTSGDFETLLVGTWVTVHTTGYETINGTIDSWDEDDDDDFHVTFYSDGTANNDDGDTWKWKVTGNILTFFEVEATYDNTRDDEEFYTILTLTETQLVIYYYEEGEDGYVCSVTITLRKS